MTDLMQQGSMARAAGTNLFDNPFYHENNMPAATGEERAVWEAKVKAWDAGWIGEDTIREGMRSAFNYAGTTRPRQR